jgi:hypothetical protein
MLHGAVFSKSAPLAAGGKIDSKYEIKAKGYPRSNKEVDSIKKVQSKKQKYVKKNSKV